VRQHPNQSALQDAFDWAVAQGRMLGGHDPVHRLCPIARPARPANVAPTPGLFHLNGEGLAGLKQDAVAYALDQSNGCQAAAARTLKVSRSTLNSMLRRGMALVCLGFLVSSAAAQGADVMLAWTPPASPGITNYILYASTNALTTANRTNAAVRMNCGTNTTALLEGLPANTTWNLGVSDQAGGVQSDLSNILIVQVPAAPAALRTVAIQYGITLTNFADAGFFRLRIPAPAP